MGRVNLYLVVIFGILTFLDFGSCLNKAKFCRIMCARGQGGDACRCNAVHFAGKRTSSIYRQSDLPDDIGLPVKEKNEQTDDNDLAYLVHVIAKLRKEKGSDSAEFIGDIQPTLIHDTQDDVRTKRENELQDQEKLKNLQRYLYRDWRYRPLRKTQNSHRIGVTRTEEGLSRPDK